MLHETLAALVRLAAARYAAQPRLLGSGVPGPHPRLADKAAELLRAFVLPLEKKLPVLTLLDEPAARGNNAEDRDCHGTDATATELRCALRLRQVQQ